MSIISKSKSVSNQKESIKRNAERQIISGIISKADTLAATNVINSYGTKFYKLDIKFSYFYTVNFK